MMSVLVAEKEYFYIDPQTFEWKPEYFTFLDLR